MVDERRVTVLGLVGGASGKPLGGLVGAGRVFHNSIPPSKQNRLGKLPRVRLCALYRQRYASTSFRRQFLVGLSSEAVGQPALCCFLHARTLLGDTVRSVARVVKYCACCIRTTSAPAAAPLTAARKQIEPRGFTATHATHR